MRLQFVYDKVSHEGDIQTKIARKIARLDKYLKHVSSDLREGMVKLARGERFGYQVKVDLKVPGHTVVAMERDKNLLSAVDHVVDKLRHGIAKSLGKARRTT
jgi:ribosomal subunit interface protein